MWPRMTFDIKLYYIWKIRDIKGFDKIRFLTTKRFIKKIFLNIKVTLNKTLSQT